MRRIVIAVAALACGSFLSFDSSHGTVSLAIDSAQARVWKTFDSRERCGCRSGQRGDRQGQRARMRSDGVGIDEPAPPSVIAALKKAGSGPIAAWQAKISAEAIAILDWANQQQ